MDNSSPERCLSCRQQEAEWQQQESECDTVTYRQPPTYNHQTTNHYQILSERGRHCLCMYITHHSTPLLLEFLKVDLILMVICVWDICEGSDAFFIKKYKFGIQNPWYGGTGYKSIRLSHFKKYNVMMCVAQRWPKTIYILVSVSSLTTDGLFELLDFSLYVYLTRR